jgi:hypothetical protein
MARLLVEILINAAGGPKARAAFDDVGAGAQNASRGVTSLAGATLQTERALRRTAEAAQKLNDQMEETAAAKGLIADYTALNKKLDQQLLAYREGAAGLARYEQQQRESALAEKILATQVRAGVSAQSQAGKEIAEQIARHDRLQRELKETAAGYAVANRAEAHTGDTSGVGAGLSASVSVARSFIGTATAAAASAAALGYSINKLVSEAANGEAEFRQLEAAIIATGGVTGYSADELKEYADSLDLVKSAGEITDGMSRLVGYTKIQGEMFKQATEAAIDMSVALKQDLTSSAETVGKALNYPSQAMASLSKQGFRFTEEQKRQIKQYEQTNQIVKAQEIVLGELTSTYGGSAAAIRDTLQGAQSTARNVTNDLMSMFGEELSPVIRDLAEDYIEWARAAETQEQIAEWGRLVADAVRGAVSALDLLSPALRLIGAEAKIILTILSPLLNSLGWLSDRLDTARGYYLSAAESAGIFGSKASSIPFEEINQGLGTNQSAVFALREEYGKLGNAAIEAARKQLESMSLEAEMLRQKAGKLRQSETSAKKQGSQYADERSEAAFGRAANYAKEAKEAEDAARNLDNIVSNLTSRLEGHSKAAQEAADTTSGLGDETESARESARKLMADLLDEAESQRRVTKAAKESTSAHRQQVLTEEQLAKVTQIRTAYIKAGLAWTDKQTDAVYEAVRALKELKTQEDAALRLRELWLTVRVDTTALDKAISEKNKKEIEADLQFRREAFEVNRQNQANFAKAREEAQTQLQEQADYFRASLVTPHEEVGLLREQLDILTRSVDDAGEPLLSAAEASEIYARAVNEVAAASIQAAGELISQLTELSRSTSAAKWGKVASGIGNAVSASSNITSMAAMFGAAGAWMTAFLAIAELGTKKKGDHFGAFVNADTGGDAQLNGAWTGVKGQLTQAQQIGRDIANTLNDLIRGLGASFADFAEFHITQRGEGWKVNFAEGADKMFRTFEEARDYAIMEAIKRSELRGLDPEIAASLRSSTAETMEEFQEQFTFLQQYANIGVGADAQQIRDLVRGFEDAIDKAHEYGLSVEKVSEQFAAVSAGLRNDILGIKENPEEQLRRRVTEYNNQVKLEEARTRLEKGRIEREAAMLRIDIELAKADASIGVAGLKVGQKIIEGEAGLINAEVGMLKILLDALAVAEQALADLDIILSGLKLITDDEVNAALGRLGRGGSGVDTKQLRQDLRDEIAGMRADAAGGLTRTFFDLEQSIQDFKDRAKEANLPADELAEGLRLLGEQFKKTTRETAQGYAGIGTDYTRRLREGLDFFDELETLGRNKTGIPDWLREVYEGRFSEAMGREIQSAIGAFNGLVDPMLEIAIEQDRLRQNTLAYAEAAGWSADQIAEAMAAIDAGGEYQRQQGINSTLDRLFGYLREAGKFEEEALDHDREKALLDIDLIAAQLEFYGALTGERQGWIDAAREFVRSANFGAGSSSSPLNVRVVNEQLGYQDWLRIVQEWRRAVQEFADATRDLYTDDALSNLTQEQQLAEARSRFTDLAARANAGDMGALRQLAQARQEYLSEARESYQGGAGYEQIWREVLMASAGVLSGAQESEDEVWQRALREANETNTQHITTAVYDSANQIVDAIYRMFGGMPAYATGGTVTQPTIARIGESGPEAIIPLGDGSMFKLALPPGYNTQRTISNTTVNQPADMSGLISVWQRIETIQRRTESRLGGIEQSSSATARSNARMARADRRRNKERTRR